MDIDDHFQFYFLLMNGYKYIHSNWYCWYYEYKDNKALMMQRIQVYRFEVKYWRYNLNRVYYPREDNYVDHNNSILH
jgi:hypothetical protein